MLPKEKLIHKGVIYGLKIWLISGVLAPFVGELEQVINTYGKGFYEFGDFLQLEPGVYLYYSIIQLVFFLIPCIIGGLILGLFGRRERITRSPISPLFLGLLNTVLGYGSLWILLFSKTSYMQEYSYWVEFLTMLIFQSFLWAWAINRFNLWFKKNNR